MNSYHAFKTEYIRVLKAFLDAPAYAENGIYIESQACKKLANRLADLEEEHPIWTERVEDWIEEERIAKGFTYSLEFSG